MTPSVIHPWKLIYSGSSETNPPSQSQLSQLKKSSFGAAEATAAHPDDEGWFTRYIPKEKVARIYAV